MPFITTAVDGGLDLVTPPVSVVPGRLQDCSNFEVALNQGVKSIDGFELFDGGISPSGTARLWRVDLSWDISGNPDFRDYLDDQDFSGYFGFINYTVAGGAVSRMTFDIVYTETYTATTGAAYFVTRNQADSNILGLLVSGLARYGFYDAFFRMYTTIPFDSTAYTRGTIVANAQLSTVSDDLAAKAAYYNIVRAKVQEVPGQGNVLGLFWLKDELYACRDYVTLAYDTPLTEPAYNDELFIGASYAAATWKGFLAKQITTSAASDDVSGIMMFYNTTGTPSTGAIKNHSALDAAVATITSTDVSSQGAGLYRADGSRGTTVSTQSWTHQEIGYSARYKDADLEFTPANRLAPTTPQEDLIQSTVYVVAATRKTFGDPTGQAWTAFGGTGNFTDCLANDDGDTSYWFKSYSATPVPGDSPYFWVSNFGLTDADVPDGSAITGFTVEVVRRVEKTGTPAGGIYDAWLKLAFASDSGVGGNANFGNGGLAWGPTYETVTYGGAQSLLGYTNVSAEDVKSADFGFQMAVGCVGYVGPGTFSARVTEVKIKVHFIPPQSKIYFWNGDDPSPTAVEAEVVQSYKTSGEVGAIGNKAKGALYLMNVGTNRPIGSDEEIRTMPLDPAIAPDGGAGDSSQLIALTETAVSKNVMDWGDLLRQRGSKYQYVTHNFYAAANFDAIYGVSGAGPAFMYDGYAFTKILTGTPPEYEIPRHVITHQQRLFLGYGSGQYMWSEPGEPLIFDALTGTSAEDGVGASIRGFMELNGDALAIFHQNGVAMIQGDVGLEPYPGVITADVGCVEYSAQSMGNYMYMSFRGAQNLRSTPAYGDFDHAQFSWDVWSWLSPRVQTSAFFESANIGLINSYPVRNKSQCRWCFADGAQLTATFLRAGEMPQFTIQNYTNASGDPLTWDVLTAGVESNGRDRLFGATNDGTGHVYEIDRGYSFDGANIDAYATLVVMDQGSPQQYKEFTDMQVHGKATDYATFTTSRAVNYGEPDPAKRYRNRFGSLTAVPTGEERYYSSAIPIRNMGRNLVLRFDRSSNDQPPVTIQAISYNIVPAGEKQT
jgi:hypothetical protein